MRRIASRIDATFRSIGAHIAAWRQAAHRRRRMRKDSQMLDHLDNARRRDIGLPPRGAAARQVYYHW